MTGVACRMLLFALTHAVCQVSSVAIEDIYYKDNTSIIQEEVLAHRIGLIPLAVDPEKLEVKRAGEPSTALNTLVFSLDVTANPSGVTNVYSSSLVWVPQTGQAEVRSRLVCCHAFYTILFCCS